jgi:hypothetical protein
MPHDARRHGIRDTRAPAPTVSPPLMSTGGTGRHRKAAVAHRGGVRPHARIAVLALAAVVAAGATAAPDTRRCVGFGYSGVCDAACVDFLPSAA